MAHMPANKVLAIRHKLANEVLFAGLERDLCIRYTFEFLQFLDYLYKR